MRRRRVLTVCGTAIVTLPGCFADRSDDTSTASDTPTATPTGTPRELTVEFDTLQPALVGLNVDAFTMITETETQYLYLHVAVDSGEPPVLSDFTFRFDGEDHAPRTPDTNPTPYRAFEGNPYEVMTDRVGSDTGWVLFELPETGNADDAALIWPGGEWRPGDDLRARLAAPLPVQTLTEWHVPETVTLDSDVTFGLTVENEGDRSSQFVGGINGEGWEPHRPVAFLSRSIPPGESVSWEVDGEEIKLRDEEISENVDDGEPDITYQLVWAGGEKQQSVRIVNG